MARIDAKRSGITTNIPESVLRGLKSPALGFSWRYRDSSGFPFSADSHFYFSPFHFWLLLRRLYNTDWNIVWRCPDPFQPFYVAHKNGGWKWGWLRQTSWNTQSAFAKWRRPRYIATELQADMHRQVHVHSGTPCKFNHYMHACFARNYPEALSHCGHGHDLTSVAQLSVINKADIRSALDKTLASERFRQNAVDDAP